MKNITRNTIKVNVPLPRKDFLKWEDEQQTLSVQTEFNGDTNNFTFRLTIPKFVYDKVKDTDSGYYTNPLKVEAWETKEKKFTKTMSYSQLGYLLTQLTDLCVYAMSLAEREEAKTEKYIAINFVHGNLQRKDDFNFASMGKQTQNSFQFFTVYKIIKSPHSLDRYNYKSDVRIGSKMETNKNANNKKWHYYGVGTVERFKLVRWTQEREDFLTKVQTKFVDMNDSLDVFLGNITDDKIEELMTNSPKFLLEN